MKRQEGITIVTLAITIIILGILAGISISTLIGDNGIIVSTKSAKENMELTKTQEGEKANQLYEQLTGYDAQVNTSESSAIERIEKELSDFKKAIAQAITEAGGCSTEQTATKEEMVTNIKGIVAEVTKNATATEEDIIEGKSAWVNGILVEGTKDAEAGRSYTLPEIKLGHSFSSSGTTYPSYVHLPLVGINYLSFSTASNNGYSYITIELVKTSSDGTTEETVVLYEASKETPTLSRYDVSEYDYITFTHYAKNNNSAAYFMITDFTAEIN